MDTETVGGPVAVSFVYDDSLVHAFRERPERVEVFGGHWHYEYGDGVTTTRYHSTESHPAA